MVFKCECKTSDSFEAKQPNAILVELNSSCKQIHLCENQIYVRQITGDPIGTCIPFKDTKGDKWILFNNHFMGPNYNQPFIKFGETVIELKNNSLVQRFKKTDVCRVPIAKDSQVRCLRLAELPEEYANIVHCFTIIHEAPQMSTGTAVVKGTDKSGTYHHYTSNYYSVGGFCGSAISIDGSCVHGLHYHTNGEGKGNNFMGFTAELFAWLVSPRA
jgi:hypothetical protein